jgi:hypothetical protein
LFFLFFLYIGRAIHTLQQTLPDFFNIGLVSCLSDQPKKTSLSELIISPLHGGASSVSSSEGGEGNNDPGIYSPRVRLSYTPSVVLPAPFNQTLHIEGFPLYLASSVFIRHTLNALYSDMSVTLSKMTSTPSSGSSKPSYSGHTEPGATQDSSTPKGIKRDKSVVLSMSVVGMSRVSGTKGQWDIKCTYTFSPISGLILSHVVNEIDPAPHSTAYEALRAGLGLKWMGAGATEGTPIAALVGDVLKDGNLKISEDLTIRRV